MTDELTPEQEAAVSRLLAEARHDEPAPADVSARLDEVLERLVANEDVDDLEVFESARPASVTELAGARRRRRNGGRLLLAAAVIVIGGVAVGQALGDSSFDGGSSDSAGDSSALAEAPRASADEPEADQGAGGGDNADGSTTSNGAPSAPAYAQDLLTALDVPLQLSSESFAADVQRELRRTASVRSAAANEDLDGLSAYSLQDSSFSCADGPYGEGAKLPAYYDAEEAVLVLRRPRGGIQRVVLLTCGTATELDTVELPAPQ